MEFETDKWTIQKSDIDGVGVFLLEGVARGECLGMAHMLHPGTKNVLAYYNSLGRFHNHSSTPNFVARVEGNFTKIYAIKDSNAGDEVTVDYGNYSALTNIRLPGEIKEQVESNKMPLTPTGAAETMKRIEAIRERNEQFEREKREREALPSPPATKQIIKDSAIKPAQTTENKKVLSDSKTPQAKNLKPKTVDRKIRKTSKRVRNLKNIASKAMTSKTQKKQTSKKATSRQTT